MQPNLTRNLIVFGLTALMAVTLVPMNASAQGASPSFTIDDITTTPAGTPVQPDGLGIKVDITWHYDYGGPAIYAVGNVQPSANLVWDIASCTNDNGGTIVTGSLGQSFSLDDDNTPSTPAPSRVDGVSHFTISATRQAPGERLIPCSFKGHVGAIAGTSQIPESSPDTNGINIQVAYLGILTADVPTTIQEAGPQKEIRYDIKLTNRGNALSNVKFELVGAVESGWLALAPPPTQIDSLQQGGTTNQATIGFLVSTPHKNGWNNADTGFTLKITPSSTLVKENTGAEVTVPVIARVRGIYVPGPDPILMVGAVLGTALVARLLRKND